MPHATKETTSFKLPEIVPGGWRGEILGSCTLNFGQVVQEGPPRQSVEFTYMVIPASVTMPERRFTWPSIIMIMAPTPTKTDLWDAGLLYKTGQLPSLTLSLQVTRDQFSDMIRMLESKRLKDFHFTVENGADGSWPVSNWGMALTFA